MKNAEVYSTPVLITATILIVFVLICILMAIRTCCLCTKRCMRKCCKRGRKHRQTIPSSFERRLHALESQLGVVVNNKCD